MASPSCRHILAVLLLALCSSLAAMGQTAAVTQITGLVRDSVSHEGIPYASISLLGTNEGVIANDRGGFTIHSRAAFSSLKVTAMGYGARVVPVKSGQGSVVLIELAPSGVQLGEVVVNRGKEKYSKKDNPAVDLVKRLRARRDDGDPRRHPYYSYCQYERMMVGFGNLDEVVKKPDDLQWAAQYADTSLLTGQRVLPFSIKETVARDYYSHDPDVHRQVIIGTKSAGIDEQIDQTNVKKVMDDFLREVDIFHNDVTLLTNRFVSPLSRIAVDFYKFYLNDTVTIDGERCAVLSFVPFTPQTFGFLGRLYVSIEDSTLFIKRVAMGVPHDINLNYVERMSIVQDYERAPDGGTRLKVRDEVEVSMRLMTGLPELFARRETSYRDHHFERPDGGIFHQSAEQSTSASASFMPEEFWHEYRPAGVKTTGASVSGLMKRLRGYKLFYWAERAVVMMVNGYVPTSRESRVDIGPLNTIVSGNSLEGLRLRLGGMTTTSLSKQWFARAYAAYGLRDHKWKYMASLEYSFTPKKALDQEFPIHSLRLTHRYDVDKLSQHYLYTNQDNMFLTLRRHKDTALQYLRTTRLEYRREWFNHFSIALAIEHNVHEATRYLPFVLADGTSRRSYTQAGFTLQLRYAPGETFYQARSYRIPINMDAPIITVTQTFMPKGFLGSLHEVNKTAVAVQRRFWFSAFGYADVIIKGEKIWSRVAYPDLLMPNVNLSYTIQPESFSLMKPMEFISDQSLSWDLTYWGGGVLMNRLPLIRRLRLREVVSLRGLWGNLSDRNNPAKGEGGLFLFPGDVLCQDMEGAPYLEAAVGLDNILTVLRVDYVWRLTHRRDSGSDRRGIRVQLHFNF